MSTIARPIPESALGASTGSGGSPPLFPAPVPASARRHRSESVWAMALRSRRVAIGGGILLGIILVCVLTLPWTLHGSPGVYELPSNINVRQAPHFREILEVDKTAKPIRFGAVRVAGWFGDDPLGRSMLARCLLGGVISLGVGVAAATISVIVGVTVGLIAGYRGGWIDALLMRSVDVLYGLPYILLVILFKIAFEGPLSRVFSAQAANLVVLFCAIGLVSWLTMARVVRGQVLSLRSQPFVEACRAMGLPQRRIFLRHMLPNLVGPITVYATLTVPSAILQESFLSFLGVGVNPPIPTWGSLAGDAVNALSPVKFYWWMLVFPCVLLAITLLSLNFLGDGLRDVFDPKREAAKI
jgi:oligopeptide transport system permease protein